jgi:hypothetical protein
MKEHDKRTEAEGPSQKLEDRLARCEDWQRHHDRLERIVMAAAALVFGGFGLYLWLVVNSTGGF